MKNSSQNVPSLLPVTTGRSVVTDDIDSGDDGMGNDVTSVICDDVIPEVVKASDCEEAKACWWGCMWLKLHVKMFIKY